MLRFLSTIRGPITREQEEAAMKKILEQDKSYFFVIADKEGVPLGTVGLHYRAEGVCEHGVMIGEKEARNRGLGTEAGMLLLRFAFQDIGLRKIRARVWSTNPRSLAHLLKMGYQEEGRRRKEVFKQGKWVDEIMLGVFPEEFAVAYNKWCDSN